MTLVSLACSSPLEEGIVSQIDYLVNKQKADVSINDTDKNTPLHHLACNSVKDSNDVSVIIKFVRDLCKKFKIHWMAYQSAFKQS